MNSRSSKILRLALQKTSKEVSDNQDEDVPEKIEENKNFNYDQQTMNSTIMHDNENNDIIKTKDINEVEMWNENKRMATEIQNEADIENELNISLEPNEVNLVTELQDDHQNNAEQDDDFNNFEDFEESGSEFLPGTDENESENSRSSNNLEDNTEAILMTDGEAARNEELLQERANRKGRPKKGRKTKYPGQTFKNRKTLKYLNKRHYNVKGKLIEPKTFIDFQCNCKLKCPENVPALQRATLFNKFWQLGSYDLQTGFIAATVTQKGLKRKRNKNSTKRSCTRVYQLSNIKVCRNMYINTYQVSTKRIDTALKKLITTNLKDQRGDKQGGANKLPADTKNKIICQIKKFPTYISHYTRNETESRFLATDLTLSKMYSLYIDEGNPKVSFTAYQKLFYENFNLKRKPPVKDTCNVCDELHTKIQNAPDESTKEQFNKLHENHLNMATAARKAMKSDFENATKCNALEVISYDMEKVLGLPKLPTNIIYYKRQLSLFNEGIHSATTDTPYCFIWREGTAGRGAQEVGSCLKQFIDTYLYPGTEELIVWSDSCGGQNRNIKIVLLLKAVLESHKSLKTIYFKYLIPGHSFLPNDSDFGEIERALKYQLRVYTMEEFRKIVSACKKKHPFVVFEMKTENFSSTEEVEKVITNRKKDTEGEKANWLKTRVIKIEQNKPFSIFLKHSHEDIEFKEINIGKSRRGQGRPAKSDFISKLKVLYPEGKEISEKKMADIKSLMPLIPIDVRDYYKNLTSTQFDDDIDGFGAAIDFEIEEEES